MTIYNISLFGVKFKTIRKSRGLSFKTLENLSTITRNTLRSIERGTSIPSLNTLSILSKTMKCDLLDVLSKCCSTENRLIFDFQLRIDILIESRDYIRMHEIAFELKQLLESNNCLTDYQTAILNQLYHWTIGINLSQIDNNYSQAYIGYIKALSITFENYDIKNYTKYVYSHLELKILNSIAISQLQCDNLPYAIELLNFILTTVKNEIHFINDYSYLYTNICYNLSSAYFHLEDYSLSLKFALEGIDLNLQNRSHINFWQLYFRKGRAEYELNNHEYKNSFLYAKTLYEIEHPDSRTNQVKTLMKKLNIT